jgi:putative transposase
MGGPRASSVTITERQHAVLQRLSRRQTACQRLVRRVAILLALMADPCIATVSRQLRVNRMTVRLWRDRWADAQAVLQRIEQDDADDDTRLTAVIEAIFDDDPRPGAPATFTPEQIVGIVAVACEPPDKSGRPISHWTARELADEVQKRQIVSKIHPTTVGRFLKTGRFATAPQPVLAQRQARRPQSVSGAGGQGV